MSPFIGVGEREREREREREGELGKAGRGGGAQLGMATASALWRAGDRWGRVASARIAREGLVFSEIGGAGRVRPGRGQVVGQLLPVVHGAVTARNRERREERDGGDGSFVNKMKFNVLFVNSIFLFLPVLK